MQALSAPDPTILAAIMRFGRTALAWEVLRRDPAYIAAVGEMTTLPQHGRAATAQFAARWGLHFP
jgi:hypothetical protein